MIQVQTRIFVRTGEMPAVEIDVLEREDANRHERKIAEAVEALVLKMHHHVMEKAGIDVQVIRIEKQPAEPCVWTFSSDLLHEYWETACGDAFVFNTDGPAYHGLKYCPYCGRVLQEAGEDEPYGGKK